jgi:hypothetical protein
MAHDGHPHEGNRAHFDARFDQKMALETANPKK